MDCSNPVKDSSRMTVKEMMEQSVVGRRQDIEYLRRLADGASRTVLSAMPDRGLVGGKLKAEVQSVTQITQVDVDPRPDLKLDFLLAQPEVPVCGLMYEGVPIHPAGVNQEKGLVKTTRVFGGSKRDELLFRSLLMFLEPETVKEAAEKFVYTRGQASGFEKRLLEQTTRKCVSVKKYWKGSTRATIVKRLEKLLPIDADLLPDWGRDIIDQLMDLKTSKVATAGAPYWKDKPDAMTPMVDVVLPLVHEAICDGTLEKLWQEQPELFLGEVKNKLDRYDPLKLGDKCRPYFSLPFHWQALFSMLSQGFTHAMHLFHQKKGSANAYGFSWAHGGGQKLVEWAQTVQEGELQFYCYGDDSDVFYRKDGKLMRISPDFRQMDGSVDHDLVEACVEYVRSQFARKWGENPFWDVVCKLWVKFATHPDFLVHGTTVYRKPQKDGLMTGVVGTTFFDTAKSVLAYSKLAEEYSHNPAIVEEKNAIPFFKKLGLEIKAGTWSPDVVVAEPSPGVLFSKNKFLGTQLLWMQGPTAAEPVPYLPPEDWLALLANPRDDPSEKVGLKRGAVHSATKVSALSRARTNFDRWRGYLVTGAFSHPDMRDLLYGLLATTDPAAVLMSVAADGGRGEKPEAFAVCGDDFSYPTSEGIPTLEWCANLYFSEENQFTHSQMDGSGGLLWTPVFPTLEEEIRMWREKWRQMKPQMRVVQVSATEERPGPTSSGYVASAVLEETSESGYEGSSEEAILKYPGELVPSVFTKEGPLPGKGKPNPRSKIENVVIREEKVMKESRKRLPNTGDLLLNLFQTKAKPSKRIRTSIAEEVYPHLKEVIASFDWDEDVIPPPPDAFDYEALDMIVRNPFIGDEVIRTLVRAAVDEGTSWSKKCLWTTPVLPIWEVAQGLGRGTDPESIKAVKKLVSKHGFYLVGADKQFVSKVPIFLHDEPTMDAQVLQKYEQNLKDVKVVSSYQKTIAEVVKAGPPVRTVRAPEINRDVVDGLKRIKAVPPKDESNIWGYAHRMLQANGWIPVTVSRQVKIGATQQVETQVLLTTTPDDLEGAKPVARIVGNTGTENLAQIGRELVSEVLKRDPETLQVGKTRRGHDQRRRQVQDWSGEVEQQERVAFRLFHPRGRALKGPPPVVMEVKGARAYPVGDYLQTHGVELVDGVVALEKGVPSRKKPSESWSQFYLRLKYGVSKATGQKIFFQSPLEDAKLDKNGQEKRKQNTQAKSGSGAECRTKAAKKAGATKGRSAGSSC